MASSSKKTQGKAGLPAARRGQQMGDARSANTGEPDESQADATPTRDGRTKANKFFADDSAQSVGGDAAARARTTVSPSVPAALPTGQKLGESNVERAGKRNQAKTRTTAATTTKQKKS